MIVMTRILHTSDFHLGLTVRGLRGYSIEEVRREDLRRNMRIIFEYAWKNNIDLIIISGDIFHRSTPNPRDFTLFNELLLETERRGIYTVFISGNHDRRVSPEERVYMDIFTGRGKPYSIFHSAIPDEPIILNVADRKLGIIPIPYISYRRYRAITGKSDYSRFIMDEIGRLLSRLEKCDYKLLICHILIKGCRFTDTYVERYIDEPYIPINYLYPDRFDYIALGHVHLNQRLRENIFYAGSIERIDFSEINDEKYFNIIDLEHRKVERIELPCRSMHRVRLTLQPNIDIIESIRELLAKADIQRGSLIRFEIYGNREEIKKFDKITPKIDDILLEEYKVAGYSYTKETIYGVKRPSVEAEELSPFKLKDVAKEFIYTHYRDREKNILSRAIKYLDELLEGGD